MHLTPLPSFSTAEQGREHTLLMTFALGTAQDETNATSTYVDPLDDVFGSAPASPILSAQDEATADSPSASRSDAGNISVSTPAPSRTVLDPSDVPRLREIHVTTGYREGVASSKEVHLQQGFDGGYSLGAEVGMKVGWCLGILQGILRCLPDGHDTDESIEINGGLSSKNKNEEVRSLLAQAETELAMQKLFGEDFFGKHGEWLFDVPEQYGEHEEVVETTVEKVAEAHPMVKKWTAAVKELAQSLRLALD